MKRFIAIFLTFLYIGVSSGSSLYLHYCMGEFKGMSLSQDHKDHCDNCGMLKSKAAKKGCCEEKQHEIKIEKDQRTSSYHFQFSPLYPVCLRPDYTDLIALHVLSIAETFPVSQAPPYLKSQPVYLLNRTFRI